MIKFDNVTFNYASSEEPAIQNVSLQIKQGELVVFCGKSGSGKSTVAKLINGLIPKVQPGYMSGHVYLDGCNISEIEMYQLSQMVGSVFQNPKTQFYNVDTTSELAFNLENQGIDKTVIIEKIKTIMNQFKIEHLLDRNIFELSGGEKQIIACATVLITNPDVVVLDEPSSNLDIRN
ncbi:ABC transporter ATP-binding protein [Staphylococcus schleiferi]|uniref:ABC transporter ATP-binding protein n=1 Tax=Staphylococcus schleiferi TaxID=1295 RepID=UPI0024802837|nr:ABC transporter ATP-binding protein [Staphylococcus schleiferi]